MFKICSGYQLKTDNINKWSLRGKRVISLSQKITSDDKTLWFRRTIAGFKVPLANMRGGGNSGMGDKEKSWHGNWDWRVQTECDVWTPNLVPSPFFQIWERGWWAVCPTRSIKYPLHRRFVMPLWGYLSAIWNRLLKLPAIFARQFYSDLSAVEQGACNMAQTHQTSLLKQTSKCWHYLTELNSVKCTVTPVFCCW